MTHSNARRQGLAAAARLGLLAAGLPGWTLQAGAQTAPRLISLSGGMTETVWALGAAELIVATDTSSTWPEAARHTAKVGYMRQLSAEGVLALRPTAVLGTDEVGPIGVVNQLRQAGVHLSLVPATHDLTEMLAKVQAASEASGHRAAGAALARQLRERWSEALLQVQRQRRASPPRVLFVMAHGGRPMSAGPGTGAHAMLNHAGAVNALGGAPGYKVLSAEAVARARPDVIVTTRESIDASGGTDAFWQHPGLAQTPAARQRALRVHDTQALLGFGPRSPQALLELHRGLA